MTAAIWTDESKSAVTEMLRLADAVRAHVDAKHPAMVARGDQLRASLSARPDVAARAATMFASQVLSLFVSLGRLDSAVVDAAFREVLTLNEATS